MNESVSEAPIAVSPTATKRSAVTPYWRAVGAIVWKDLRAEIRGRELINSMLLFTLMTVLVFSLAMELDSKARHSVVSGVLWVTIVFAGLLGLGRSLAAEKDRGSLDALLLAPIDRSALFVGKMIANLLFVLVISALLVVLLTVLFNISLMRPLLILIIVLGSIGYTTAGTVLASMSVHARAREALLPVILMPIVIPIFMSAVRGSTAVLNGLPSEDWLPSIWLLVIGDVFYLLVAVLLFRFVVEE